MIIYCHYSLSVQYIFKKTACIVNTTCYQFLVTGFMLIVSIYFTDGAEMHNDITFLFNKQDLTEGLLSLCNDLHVPNTVQLCQVNYK